MVRKLLRELRMLFNLVVMPSRRRKDTRIAFCEPIAVSVYLKKYMRDGWMERERQMKINRERRGNHL